MPNQVLDIPIDQLQPNPLQPRGVITPESLTDLINSIREHGILEPLVVAKTPAGYQIIAGERRWRSARIIGLKTVPAIVKKTNPQQMLEMALIENVQREDLTSLDRAKAFQQLQEEFELSVSEIAQKIGKSLAYVSNTLRLLSLPDAVKDGLLSGLISEGHARAIAGLETTEKIIQIYKQILKEKASVRRAEELSRATKKTEQKTANKKNRQMIGKEYQALKEKLQEKLSSAGKAKVKISRSRSQTRITIVWDGGIEETEDQLKDFYQKICDQKPTLATEPKPNKGQ
ncbi:MAG: ParB/RepB/Spo0J family partition protein [Candidatus Shapirobacteria bacterium]|nr:ParB/RepB/Spo0J family partition protein [Candidatus Shapirobacteria bacterium]MDD5073736.1 ParB/RepB/Spo0J family partition protein [Candidatus Shapirobacteria bacterium]MDD5481661.1 ParB/RepB/Spo0J family partition protein [Candidatus Shapirobacteria bacterium]